MDNDLDMRTAEPADAPAIAELVREAYAKWLPVAGRPPLPMTVDYAEALNAHRFDLLVTDRRLVALIETTPQGGDLLIVNVAVRPTNQGRGHGVRLLRHAEAVGADAGLAATRRYTNRLFVANVRLYVWLGYEIEREEVLNGGVAVHMRKAVAPSQPNSE
jgi:ribosomal protein S18 acetylase RimI-like enzyme